MKQWLIGIILLAVVTSGAAAVWTLRQPLRTGIDWFRRVSEQPTVVRFAVIGDNHGVNDVYRRAISAIGRARVSFLLNLADTSEFGQRQEFLDVQALEQTLPFPVYHTVGSHDIKTDPSRKTYAEVFNQEPNQTVDQGPLHLVILDNADRQVGFSEATRQWLKNDLARHQNRTVILAYHRPFGLPLAAVTGDDETAASRDSNEKFLDLIGQYQIGLILTAHLHTYLPYSLNGIPAVVSGGGGDPAQSVLGGQTNNFFHYLIVTVNGRKVTVDVHRL